MPPSFRHIKVALHHDETRFAAGSLANRFSCAKAKRQHDVGHEGAITGRMLLAFVPSIANPQGVISLRSNQFIHMVTDIKISTSTLMMS
ncbi:hypothetical protein CWD94_08025 [Lysinibacillus xylanilyticus]|uniref:Uncharacterized protein n=1 Tax=Lysinibacillus xylanilyticus TaxID=582475 RepID=A0A2M9Q823_9BACI|nr:hypothetical protein CWD94_08025 [Lysinibacillus xylanilyticus]